MRIYDRKRPWAPVAAFSIVLGLATAGTALSQGNTVSFDGDADANFGLLDENTDGFVDYNEFTAGHAAELDRLKINNEADLFEYDTNSDKLLDRNEYAVVVERYKATAAVDQDSSSQEVIVAASEPRIKVDQQPASVDVQQAEPSVEVKQSAPEVTITQQQPEVTVSDPAANVKVIQPEPKIVVTQPEPIIDVQIPEPKVIVEEAEPEVAVNTPEPTVDVQVPEPEVSVSQPDPVVSIDQPQPEISVERATPEVVLDSAQADVNVETAATEGSVNVQTADAAAVDVQQVDDNANIVVESAEPNVTVDSAEPVVSVEKSGTVTAGNEASDATVATTGTVANSFLDMRATDLEGRAVYNAKGEEVGNIDRIVVGKGDSKLAAVVEVGGFLDIGDREFAVPMEELTFEGDRAIWATELSGEQLDEMEAFDGENFNIITDRYDGTLGDAVNDLR